MALKIKQLVINSEIEEGDRSSRQNQYKQKNVQNMCNQIDEEKLEDMKHEIIRECLEKFEEMIQLRMEK